MAHSIALSEMIEKHKALDLDLLESEGKFLSHWNGGHPFVEQFLGPLVNHCDPDEIARTQYIYYAEQPGIIDLIRELHHKFEGLELSRHNVIGGPGSSSFLLAFSLWLLQQGHRQVLYIPPLYYTQHYFLKTLGIQLKSVAESQLFHPAAHLQLPSHKSVLLLCDPIWYAGRKVPADVIKQIAQWQKATGSTIFVDGSFQYLQWDGEYRESSSIFDPDKTFRLLCPTKSLAIHNFRFAYLLVPATEYSSFLFLFESAVGGSSASDLVFGKQALRVLQGGIGNRPLTSFLRDIYFRLLNEGLIEEAITPDCGYFIFAKPSRPHSEMLTMNGSYFELEGYPGYVRINLFVAEAILRTSA